MKDKIKEAFNQIQAEETLKNNTKVFLAGQLQKHTKPIKRQLHMYAAACACLLLLLIGGCWLYFTPTSGISIDINPSIELSVNRFGRIISVDGMNADGHALSDALHIKFKSYTDAVNQILENEKITELLADNEILEITVTGSDETQSAKILSEIEQCTAAQKNTYCYFASHEDTAAAHEAGLSFGKYRAYLELKQLDPDILPETIRGMTMREIRDLTEELCGDHNNNTGTSSGSNKGYGHHGSHNGQGNRKKQGEE